MKSMIVISSAIATLALSNACFAGGNDIEFGYVPPSASAGLSRAEVKSQAMTAHINEGELLGNEDDAADTRSNVSRAEVRKEAIEYVRTHKRELAELA